jgi:acyl carrier protein
MDRNQISALVISCLKAVLSSEDRKAELPLDQIDESTPLLGRGSFLDSLGLVSLIVDIEQKLNEDHGISLTIADERAMSQQKSPFRTVATLVDYVQTLVNE